MFGTLLGALPEPPADEPDPLAAIVAAQEAAGLEPITDGRGAAEPSVAVIDRWRAVAALTDRAAKAVLCGPWSAAVRAAGGRAVEAAHARAAVEAAALQAAEELRELVLALAAAGCPIVEIAETETGRVGVDAGARRAFREAHRRLADGIEATHLSLSIAGGSAWEAGSATILDPPYRSLAVDLVAGPDNWRLVAAAPRERGIVVGVVEVGERADEGPELPVWAAHYAASTRGRGLARVGIGTAGGLAHLAWPAAVTRLQALGEAVRVAGLPGGALADALDPRAIGKRSAALGRAARRRSRP